MELGPGVDASWGGEESQDLEAGVPAGRSFWGRKGRAPGALHPKDLGRR